MKSISSGKEIKMRGIRIIYCGLIICIFSLISPAGSSAWNDETHLAIARASDYSKWYNAAAADLAKLKAGSIESFNHFCNNPPGTVITVKKVIGQAEYYNDSKHAEGHLYGAIIASVRNYREMRKKGEYAESHLAYAVHYIGDLSQPLHNTVFNQFNKKNHAAVDMIINDDALKNIDKIRIYRIDIKSEADLAHEIARIANISVSLGYTIEKEDRLLTREEAYAQIGHSASLLKGLLRYLGK